MAARIQSLLSTALESIHDRGPFFRWELTGALLNRERLLRDMINRIDSLIDHGGVRALMVEGNIVCLHLSQ